jgi:transposase
MIWQTPEGDIYHRIYEARNREARNVQTVPLAEPVQVVALQQSPAVIRQVVPRQDCEGQAAARQGEALLPTA